MEVKIFIFTNIAILTFITLAYLCNPTYDITTMSFSDLGDVGAPSIVFFDLALILYNFISTFMLLVHNNIVWLKIVYVVSAIVLFGVTCCPVNVVGTISLFHKIFASIIFILCVIVVFTTAVQYRYILAIVLLSSLYVPIMIALIILLFVFWDTNFGICETTLIISYYVYFVLQYSFIMADLYKMDSHYLPVTKLNRYKHMIA